MSYLRISNVSKNYKDGENVYQALKNINLKFDKNEFVVILGESGSRKTIIYVNKIKMKVSIIV